MKTIVMGEEHVIMDYVNALEIILVPLAKQVYSHRE